MRKKQIVGSEDWKARKIGRDLEYVLGNTVKFFRIKRMSFYMKTRDDDSFSSIPEGAAGVHPWLPRRFKR